MEVKIIWLLVVSLGVLVNIILVLVLKKKTNSNPVNIDVFYSDWQEFKLDFSIWKSETNKAIEELEKNIERLKRRK